MAVNINVPSQVRTFANLAAFPASGALKTIYIAEDTNKTYRWTGSVYTEISATAASTWGAIGGTLSNQTDLQTALNAKQNSLGYTPVPETRTLTINGTTQDLSADRTFTISTGITIGTTLITSGTVGRVLFEGTGNVVQESANLTFDSATTKLQLGILTPTATTTPAVLSLGATYGTNAVGSTSNIKLKIYDDNTAGGVYGFGLTSNLLEIHSPNTTGIFSGGGATRTQVFSVNTAGSLFGSTTLIATTQPFLVALGGTYGSNTAGSVANLKLKILGSNAFSSLTDYGLGISAGLFEFSASDAFGFFTGNSLTRTERMRIFAGGNIGINTTTDAGFRLDVNGTSRVSSNISGIYDGLQVRNSAGASNAQARIKFDNDITPTQTSTGGVVFYTSSVFSGFPSSSFGLWNYNSNGVIAFATNSTERLRIFSTGNIGINTTTDAGYKLDVNGTARFQSDVTVANSLMKMYVTGGAIRFEQQGGAGFPIGFMQNGSFYQYIDQATLNIAFRNDYSFVMTTGNTSTINASAKMQIDSTTKGFLPPRMTTTQKNAIATPATGLQIFDTTLNRPCFYDGTTWITL